MNQIIVWLHNPAVVLGMYAVFNLIVDSMPEIRPTSGTGYTWLYKIMHTVSGNLKTARGLKMLIPPTASASTSTSNVIDANQTVQAAQVARQNNGGSRWDDLTR